MYCHSLKDMLYKCEYARFVGGQLVLLNTLEQDDALHEEAHGSEHIVSDSLNADEEDAAEERHCVCRLAFFHPRRELSNGSIVQSQGMQMVFIQWRRRFETRAGVVLVWSAPGFAIEGRHILRVLVEDGNGQ